MVTGWTRTSVEMFEYNRCTVCGAGSGDLERDEDLQYLNVIHNTVGRNWHSVFQTPIEGSTHCESFIRFCEISHFINSPLVHKRSK